MNEIGTKLQNGGSRFGTQAIAAICGALLGSVLTSWGPSKADFVTVREHVEFQQHIADKFGSIEKEIGDLKVSIRDIQERMESLKHQIDDRFNAVELKRR